MPDHPTATPREVFGNPEQLPAPTMAESIAAFEAEGEMWDVLAEAYATGESAGTLLHHGAIQSAAHYRNALAAMRAVEAGPAAWEWRWRVTRTGQPSKWMKVPHEHEVDSFCAERAIEVRSLYAFPSTLGAVQNHINTGETMGFVERETARIATALQESPVDSEKWKQLMAAQQALKWAADPDCFASPLNAIERLDSSDEGPNEAHGSGASAAAFPTPPARDV